MPAIAKVQAVRGAIGESRAGANLALRRQEGWDAAFLILRALDISTAWPLPVASLGDWTRPYSDYQAAISGLTSAKLTSWLNDVESHCNALEA